MRLVKIFHFFHACISFNGSMLKSEWYLKYMSVFNHFLFNSFCCAYISHPHFMIGFNWAMRLHIINN